MNSGSSMKPRKAQVKDKGLGTQSGDFGLRVKSVTFEARYKASASPFPLNAALSAKT